MIDTRTRVINLEAATKNLLKLQEKSEKKVNKLAEAMVEFKEEMRIFRIESEKSREESRQEMKAFKDEMRVFRVESEKNREADRRAMQTFQTKAEKDREEDRLKWEQTRRDMNKKWGDLANKMGTLVEDIVVPGFYGVIKSCFNQDPEDIVNLSPRVTRQHPDNRADRREFDCIAWTEGYVFHNETKSNVNMKDIETFIANKDIVFEYFPEVRGKILVPIFSSLFLRPEHIDALTEAGCYAMMMGDENMEIVNFDRLGPPG